MRLLTLTILLLASGSALAASKFDRLDKFFIGGSISSIDFDYENADFGYTTTELIGGYKYNGYLSVDLRLGLGTGDSSSSGSLTSAALYWRPETANETAKIYGLVGVATVSISDQEGTDDSYSEAGLSYGAGVGFTFDQNWNLNFEYRYFLDNSDVDSDGFTVNVDYRF